MTDATAPAAQVAFIAPGNWVALRIPHTESDVDSLVAELLCRHPELEARRELVTDSLRSLGRASAVAGCVYAGGGFLPIPGGPLPVTLLVNALPPEAAATPSDLAGAASPGRRDYTVTEVELPYGKAVRAEWFQTAQLDSSDVAVISFVTQYFVLPREGTGVLVLTFSSPAVALTPRLKKLFHDIARSLEVVS